MLNAYSDSVWGSNPANGKSNSSYMMMMMCNGPRENHGGHARVSGPDNYGSGACGGSIGDEGGSVLPERDDGAGRISSASRSTSARLRQRGTKRTARVLNAWI